MRHGGEERGVRLDQEAVDGDGAYRIPQRVGIPKGHDARHRNVKPEVEIATSVLGVAREAVHDTPRVAQRLRAEERGRVEVRIADVYDEREPELAGEARGAGKCLELCGARGVVVVVVEPGLADGNHSGA